MLGEKITATINAKYYFGSPVTEAKVKYKVLRTNYASTWYPPMPWDWLYGPGYWWFAYDYDWYPGWQRVGLPAARRPGGAGSRRVRRRWCSRGEVADRPRRHGRGRDRHGRWPRRCTATRTISYQITGRSGRPIAADDRRHGQGAGGPRAVPGLRLGRPRLLPRGRHDRRPASRPAGSTASRSKAKASCGC